MDPVVILENTVESTVRENFLRFYQKLFILLQIKIANNQLI